jgi:pimeloyl-ACP methyl ester carboxylesterase
MAKRIVCIHGALGTGAQLAQLVSQLHESSATALEVHAVELPGHGDTLLAAHEYRIEGFSAWLTQYLSARDLVGATLFGYSMGGYIALYMASEWPDLVSGVITLGTKLAWSPEIAARETSRLDAATIRAKVPKFAEMLEARHRGAGGWELVLDRTAALMTRLGSAPTIDAERLSRIPVRVRLMVGDRDNVVSVDETLNAARNMASADTCVLPSTPHPFEQVRAALVAAMIRDFLA